SARILARQDGLWMPRVPRWGWTPASPNITHPPLHCKGLYPLEIEVQWLKNSRLEEEDVAFGEKLQNGDWTYHRGTSTTCQVGHASLEAPITVQWGKPLSYPEKG
uniref:Immunoglobulin C1-set domain-containing protein n=1 Tax=Laticauda laticaudata TaxID=8630 RepID=A0A8C5SEU6_LATLA